MWSTRFTPTRLFLIVLAVIFCAEYLVMWWLPEIVDESTANWRRGLVDALLLTAICAPVLWLSIIGPLQAVAQEERERAQAIVANAADAILLVNASGIIRSANHAAEVMFRMPQATLVGKVFKDLMLDWPGCQSNSHIYESRVCTNDGSSIPVSVSSNPVRLHSLQKCVILIHDLTQQKLAEQKNVQRAEQMAVIAQVATSVAHEIRNPLTSVKLLIQTNREEAEAKGFPVEDLELIEQEIRRMEASLVDFLKLARPKKACLELVDLGLLLSRTIRLIEQRAMRQGVTIQFERPSQSINIMGDWDHLQQLMLNLAMNALDSMPQGGEVTFSLKSIQTSGIEIHVADVGTGFAADVLPRLFDAFVTTKPTGTGLGLVVCRQIVEEHGGRISAANLPGGGGIVKLWLPASNPDAMSSESELTAPLK